MGNALLPRGIESISMLMGLQKFKLRKSWNEFGHSHYLTFSTFQRNAYLSNDRICQILADRITKAARDLNFAVLAYVFMPDHVHLLIHPMDHKYEMAAILKAIKQGPSKSARNRRLITTVLWESGGGYDSNISHNSARVEVINYIHRNPVRKELVEDSLDYYWSSANWYVTGREGAIECIRIAELWS